MSFSVLLTAMSRLGWADHRIFALPANGFDTVDFYDEAATEAEDKGLLSWLTGSVRDHDWSLVP